MNKGGDLNRVKGLGGRAWIILGLLVVMFSIQDFTVFAQEIEENQPKDIFKLSIPSSWGRIKEVYKGSSEAVIIHIQDAHANYEAQKNIANIIDLLVSEYGINLAGVEGSVGRLPTELYSTFPEDTVREQASDFFVREGTFSGPEALVISKGFEYPLELYGIEDKQLYDNNFEAFKTSLPFKEEAKEYFSYLSRSLSRLKEYLYTPEISKLDEKQLAFDLKFLTLNEYCSYLAEKIEKEHLNEDDYPNLLMLVKAIKIEQNLDFVKAEDERTKLLTELTNILSEDDIRKLLDKGLAYKNEQLSASKYLNFVKDLALANKIDFNKYKNLDKYIKYAKSYDEIKSFELFNEIEEADAALREKVYENDDQRKLDTLRRGLRVMGRLIDIKMVNKDLSFYKQHQDELKTDAYLDFISEQSDKFGLNIDMPPDISYLDVYIPAWVEFYRVAGLRDDAMIRNTLKIIKEKTQKAAIMVTGGFHTRQLTKKMREQGISYLVITPRITRNLPGPYFNRLMGKKTNFQAFMEEFNKVIPENNLR